MFCVCLRQICGSYFYMIYMKISDEGLWELCLKGDMRAFRELYCRFYALLRNYGIKLLPDKSLVEDSVQDIFIKLIQNHETLSPTVNVKGYLLKTLRHKLYDTIEKNRKMEDISLYEDTFQTDELFSRISLDTTEADERWDVFSIIGVIRRIIAGIKNTTVRRLRTIPFASTSPISNPILNFIKHRTINPTIVVRLLAKMEFNASLIALLNAVI